MQNIRLIDMVRNEVVLQNIGKKRKLIKLIKEMTASWLGHVLR